MVMVNSVPRMYRLGHRSKQIWRKIFFGLAAIVLLLAVGGFLAAKSLLKSDTQLNQDQPLVTVAGKTNDQKQQIREKLFTFALLNTWKAVDVPKTQYNLYSWRGTTQDDTARLIDVYVDVLPLAMPVNRLLPLQGNEDRLNILNTVSDNCASFTGTATQASRPGTVLAKWSGVNFSCDLANYMRNVVGTGSADGLNRVDLTGSSGSHQYFFVFTDNSSSPDYSIFTDTLQSFRAL